MKLNIIILINIFSIAHASTALENQQRFVQYISGTFDNLEQAWWQRAAMGENGMEIPNLQHINLEINKRFITDIPKDRLKNRFVFVRTWQKFPWTKSKPDQKSFFTILEVDPTNSTVVTVHPKSLPKVTIESFKLHHPIQLTQFSYDDMVPSKILPPYMYQRQQLPQANIECFFGKADNGGIKLENGTLFRFIVEELMCPQVLLVKEKKILDGVILQDFSAPITYFRRDNGTYPYLPKDTTSNHVLEEE